VATWYKLRRWAEMMMAVGVEVEVEVEVLWGWHVRGAHAANKLMVRVAVWVMP
jgi:hypothetical protein